MKITIEIPVDIDGALTADERKQMLAHIKEGLKSKMAVVSDHFDREPRMLGTICRFRFGKAKATVA